MLSALQYIGFVFDIRPFTILFDIALVAAIALLYFAWHGVPGRAQGGGRPEPRPHRQRAAAAAAAMEPPAGES